VTRTPLEEERSPLWEEEDEEEEEEVTYLR